ncbi:speckle-type POZ protein-like [Diachasma alloeum]|uniref:speckle-type POZ protein-like n=1 Tax=Diachasma alloeum TaxID=454923 RepID=UPI00073833B7|nr:speckle-type POZ protein-like [Diachasma alloeum]
MKIVIGDEEFPAHKIILSANSPVLTTMFSTNMREANENRLVAEDIDTEAMKLFLTHLYTGTYNTKDNTEMIPEVLYGADKYDVKTLKKLCELQLSDRLSLENVLKIVDKADTYYAGALKDCCIDFMVKNNQKITTHADFDPLCLAKPHLMLRFIKDVSSISK